MIPYEHFYYFGILLYAVLPAVAIGFTGRVLLAQFWTITATIIMVILQYWNPTTIGYSTTIPMSVIVLTYVCVEWLVSVGFLLIRKRGKNTIVFCIVILSGLIPLIMAKISSAPGNGSIIGFMGISYLTFRVLDVMIHIQDGVVTELPLTDYCAYLLFFPVISAGPIDRYRRFVGDWHHGRTRPEFLHDLDEAIRRIFKGLFYAFILGALVKRYWLDPVSQRTDIVSILSYMYAYTFYLFFDFAGYSAFAIGISYLFGIHTPENFNSPFFAGNIREFWNRWHISLSWWFRDHVYTRFVYTTMKAGWLTDKYVLSYSAYAVTMLLMGLWHGFNWYFIVYGLYHAGLLVGYDVIHRFGIGQGIVRTKWRILSRFLSIFMTFQCICFGFLIFSGRLDKNFTSVIMKDYLR